MSQNYKVQKDGDEDARIKPTINGQSIEMRDLAEKRASESDGQRPRQKRASGSSAAGLREEDQSPTDSPGQKLRHLQRQRSSLLNENVPAPMMDEPKFLWIVPLARGCCCGCFSLKCAMNILTLVDITFGLASTGIIYIMIKSAVPITALIFRVLLYTIGGLCATYSLVQLRNGIGEETSRDHLPYLIVKTLEIFCLPFIDLFTIY